MQFCKCKVIVTRSSRIPTRERVTELCLRKIQAVVRGFLVRSRLRKEYKTKYWEVAGQGDCDTLDSHGRQISRLVKFFDPKDQQSGKAFYKHASQIIQYKTEIVSKCHSDVTWALRIIKFIRIGFLCYRQFHGSESNKRTPCDTPELTFFQAIYDEFANRAEVDLRSFLTFWAKVWLDLATSVNFFHLWHTEYEFALKREVSRAACPGRVGLEKTYDTIIVLRIFIDFISRLENGPSEFLLDNKYCTWQRYPKQAGATTAISKEAISLYLLRLFINNLIIGKSLNSPEKDYMSSGELLFANMVEVGYDQYRFPWKEWIMSHLHVLGKDQERNANRHLLAALLSLLPHKTIKDDLDVELLLPITSVLLRLIPCIDDRSEPLANLVDDDGDESDDAYYEMLNEQQEKKLSPEARALRRYCFERDYVLSKLSAHLLPLPLANWITTGKIQSLEATTLIGCLVCHKSDEEFLEHFPFMGKLAFNATYMRDSFVQIFDGNKVKSGDQLVSFVWLFQTVMKTFHDIEFMNLLQMDVNKFGKLIAHLAEEYTNDALNRQSDLVETEIYTAFLMALYERNTTTRLFPEDIFHCKGFTTPILHLGMHYITMTDFAEGSLIDPVFNEQMLYRILRKYPFSLPFNSRVRIWNRMVELDKHERYLPHPRRSVLRIRRNMLYEDTFEKVLSVQEIRNPITISLVNTAGVLEAGVDGGGLMREFLIEATKAGMDPNRGLFRTDSQNRIYPSPIASKIVENHRQHFYLLGKLVGKALYEGTFLELPFSPFFLQKCIKGDLDRPVDYLATLDPALHSNLLGLKTFKGDFSSLGLDFTVTINELGETKTMDLKKDGASIVVTETNVIEYIHLVANYKINKEVGIECYAFRSGLTSVVPVLNMFSWNELQTLISGSDKPIDIEDWKQNTNYSAGYQAAHPCILMFWQVLETFDERHRRKVLKFVTSCSRPPINGFKDLTPNFGIQSAGAGTSDRLPTSATCMNLLKLPEYDDLETLRDKVLYAIEAEAGFELS